MDDEQPPTSHITIPEEEAQGTDSQTASRPTAPAIERSDSSSTSSDGNTTHANTIHAPVPTRPRLPNRKSSGTIIVPRDSEEASRPIETRLDPGDVRAMSPRRTSEDLEQLGRQTRAEVRKHAKMLQDSLLMIFHRIQAVKEEHDKLDNNNKFLQKYIGDLMTTSKITSTGGGRGKK
ncbi:bzip transcription factor [Sporothrix schenckii 1099-18]|uniref:Bzip transcription factor n=2 Tax=Sporothrix TaxID=29907 RepID=A0A0C2JAZ0_9PEZI|nr:bzip transcription factor [Sporothrix schenckii 1099-18]XP_040622062.1 bzip transcription factor [Sporothrix brasiliensis 5110]KIH94052.1 bzip transcription factor [Sporothrix brasiliensis 5110]KJR83341.1 bzip transcription factor [Sporothrix schenckii 1099-18]